ncbi:MAG TPA: hemerythrin domain-containing protein [Ramlibacter sp.]|nr:hemerythrin domain-containing protein [Ramlibacter sp.]
MAQDAIALLESDHQRVEGLVRDFKAVGDAAARLHLAQIICMELTLHAMLEEEIFYPAFAQATGDDQLVERARKEHQHLKELIARVPSADNLDGAIEAIWRNALEHIEEERRDIFARARSSGMELATVGGRIQTRRAEVATTVQEA